MGTENRVATLVRHTEGIIPDLVEDETGEADLAEHRDAIHDYVGDRSMDLFPGMLEDERSKVVDIVTNHFCGGV